ncbi:hypothetical protein [Blautia marasmi]|nr:hypothetical protein [uncultured Blautia sp.]
MKMQNETGIIPLKIYLLVRAGTSGTELKKCGLCDIIDKIVL